MQNLAQETALEVTRYSLCLNTWELPTDLDNLFLGLTQLGSALPFPQQTLFHSIQKGWDFLRQSTNPNHINMPSQTDILLSTHETSLSRKLNLHFYSTQQLSN